MTKPKRIENSKPQLIETTKPKRTKVDGGAAAGGRTTKNRATQLRNAKPSLQKDFNKGYGN